jgi:hypothetical protein
MSTTPPTRSVPLGDLVDAWLRDGLVTPEQASALLTDADRRVLLPTRLGTRARAAALEGLGYLGGAIAVAAAITVTAQHWDELGTAGRLTVLGAAWCVLLGAGAAVRAPSQQGVSARMRTVVWLASTAAAAAFLAVLGDAVLDLRGADLGLLVGAATAAYAAGLVVWSPAPLQQVALMVALAGTAAALANRVSGSDSLPGVGVWVVGVAWSALAWSGLTRPPRLGLVGGAIAAIFGAMVTAATDPGMAFLVATLAAVVTAGVVLRDPAVLGVGALGVVVNVPAAVQRWYPGSTAAPLVLMALGLGIVALAVLAARRAGSDETTPGEPDGDRDEHARLDHHRHLRRRPTPGAGATPGAPPRG